jgi:hypothetical protein
MSEKEARERAGRLREANPASAAGSARTPPIGDKASRVNTSGKAGAQIPQLPLEDDSSPWER